MSSEAITQNDLREILSRVAGSVPSEYRKLLWTNPNPTASFSAQTISLDLSNYDEVEIEAKQLASGTIIQLCRVGIGKQTKCLFRDGNANNFYTRTFVVSASSIQFGDAYYNSTVTNTDCVPVAIYGIKYERVAPPQIDNTLEVASGTVDHSGFNAVTVAGASSSYKTISFGKTFSQIPQVVVQEHNNSLNNYGGVNTSVSYVTTTGFNLYVHGVPQATLSGLAYDWIAMTQIGE